MSYIYLASPYSHPDPAVRVERYLEAEHASHWLLSQRIWVYSPIVHCHHLAINHSLPTDADFWFDYDRVMIAQARALWVLVNKATKASKGVSGEIAYARQIKIPVALLYPPRDGNDSYTIIEDLEDMIEYDAQNP